MAYKPAKLPPERQLPNATVAEVVAYRRESPRTVFRKIRGDARLIEWASVVDDRERCLARGPQLAQPTGMNPGRPKKRSIPESDG